MAMTQGEEAGVPRVTIPPEDRPAGNRRPLHDFVMDLGNLPPCQRTLKITRASAKYKSQSVGNRSARRFRGHRSQAPGPAEASAGCVESVIGLLDHRTSHVTPQTHSEMVGLELRGWSCSKTPEWMAEHVGRE
jgi:hypothetical protein